MVYAFGSPYTARVAFDIAAFRSVLRAARKEHVGGRNKLAAKVGLAKSTIQNAEMGPDIPGIETVARLVEGMGLTLSSFFAQIEGLPTDAPAKQDQPIPSGLSMVTDDDEVSTLSPSARQIFRDLGRVFARQADRLAALERELAARHRHDSMVDDQRPGSAARAGRHPQRHGRKSRAQGPGKRKRG